MEYTQEPATVNPLATTFLETLSTLQAEVAHLRKFKEDITRILTAKKWGTASTKVVMLGLYTQATKVEPRLGTTSRELPLTTEDVADLVDISKPTAQNALTQLREASLIERESPRYQVDQKGQVVDKEKARYRDDLHWERTSRIIVRPLPEILPALTETTYQKKQRVKAAKVRELADLAQEVHQTWCPACRQKGTLTVICTHCGFDSRTGEIPDPDTELLTEGEEALRGGESHDPNQADEGDGWDLEVIGPGLEEEGLYSEATTVRTSNQESMSNQERGIEDPDRDLSTKVERLTDQELVDWLNQRIGENAELIRQVNWSKAKYIPHRHTPNFEAYLKGDPGHLYGSRARLGGGLTWILAFDFDETGHELPLKAARDLAAAGGSPVYWERANGGHLELYFDHPVRADLARDWAAHVSPAISATDEAYPAGGVEDRWKECRHQGLGWPLFRLHGRRVVSCPMHAFSRGEILYSPGWLEPGGEDVIRIALARCVTPASLIPDPPGGPAPPQPPLSASKTSRTPEVRKDESLVVAAIRWWNETHIEIDVFGHELTDGEYIAIRDDDHTPSFRRDTDGYGRPMYTDFGDQGPGGKFRKLDLFEAYLVKNRLGKRHELWRPGGVVDQYLEARGLPSLKRKF